MCWWRRAGFQECPPLLCPPNPAPLCFFVVSAPAWNERSAPCPREAGMPRGPEVAPAQRAQTKKERTGQGGPTTTPLCTALGRRRTHRSNIGRGVGASHQERLDPVKSSFQLFSVLGRMYGRGVVPRCSTLAERRSANWPQTKEFPLLRSH